MAASMTRRERLRRCFYHEETDRPAIYSRSGFPRNDPTYTRLISCIDEHTELKPNWWGGLNPHTNTETRVEPHSDDFDRRMTILHTPAGNLESTHLVSRRGLPGMDETHFLKTQDDVETYLSLPDPEIDADAGTFHQADERVGDAGIVDINLGMNPGGFVAELFGSQTFAIMSVFNRDLIHVLCERRKNDLLRKVKRLVDLGIGPFFSMLGEEFIVPPMHGPVDFNEFNVRYDKPIIDEIHNAEAASTSTAMDRSIRSSRDSWTWAPTCCIHSNRLLWATLRRRRQSRWPAAGSAWKATYRSTECTRPHPTKSGLQQTPSSERSGTITED